MGKKRKAVDAVQDPNVAQDFRARGLLGRVNREIAKPNGFALEFCYPMDVDKTTHGPTAIRIIAIDTVASMAESNV